MPLTPIRFGKSVRTAADLFMRFRKLIAMSSGALSELNLDRGDVTDDKDACNSVSGDEESACNASGIVEIT